MIQRNVRLYTTGQISHERWSNRQTQLWRAARSRQVTEHVTTIINRQAPWAQQGEQQ